MRKKPQKGEIWDVSLGIFDKQVVSVRVNQKSFIPFCYVCTWTRVVEDISGYEYREHKIGRVAVCDFIRKLNSPDEKRRKAVLDAIGDTEPDQGSLDFIQRLWSQERYTQETGDFSTAWIIQPNKEE